MSITEVHVKILEKEFQLGCSAEERGDLLDSVELLNSRMREIRDGGKVNGIDKIAILAALNIANELIQSRGKEHALETDAKKQVQTIREQVETALQSSQQLEF
ncbi:MAG: cell division protein ZapA [Chromatiales bacterium]|jgi:cell division protein ZapA|nr:cell division protein ZapA [Chromatiales bacterium]